ncbi:MAG: hypothetical protein IK990_01490 [Ruminiclostridium sp.]|nr:hypothetical protein [Ruminiclostridium sp.]
MKNTNIVKKTLAAALAAVTILGTVTTTAYAADEDNIGTAVETAAEETAPVSVESTGTEAPEAPEETTAAEEAPAEETAEEALTEETTEEAPADDTSSETAEITAEETTADKTSSHETLVDAAMEECGNISDFNAEAVMTTGVTAMPPIICLMSVDKEQKVADTLIDIDNTLIDDLADMLPMGKTLTKPLKALTSWFYDKNHENDSDPMSDLNDRIDELETEMNSKINHLDGMISGLYSELNSATNKINNKLNELSNQSDVNAEWLRAMNENSTRISKCISDLDALNSKATGISGMYYRIAGIESDTERTDLEKLVDLAALSHDPTMVSLTEKLDVLSDSMYERTGDLNTNFFDAITLNHFKDAMFTGEAYKLSKSSVDTVVEQYLTSAMLYLRTLKAENEIASLSKDELMQLGDDYIDLWSSVRKQGGSTITMRYDRVIKDMEKVVTGYLNYVKESGNDNRYIDHGKVNYVVKAQSRDRSHLPSEYEYDIGKKNESTEEMRSTLKDIYSGNVIQEKDMIRIIDHIRTNYPNTSVKQYMQDIGIDIGNAQQILCSGNITDRTTQFIFTTQKYYISAADVNNNDCVSKELELASFSDGYSTYRSYPFLVLEIQ